MSFLVYFFVLLVAASSVLFGLDWMQAPLQPPRVQRTTQAAAPAAPTPAGGQSVAVAKSAPLAAAPAVPAAATATAAPATPVSDDVLKANASEPLKTEAAEAKPAPLCDIAACERAYHTFTPADCTYQPSGGPRRLCTKGNPPGGHAALVAANEARAQAKCNVSACESAYSSFDAGSCTYQPYDGPRRLCTK